MKEFLNIKEAAKALGVSALTLRNWDKSGKFTASRHPINNYRVYRRTEVEMFLEDMKSKNWTTQNSKNQTSLGRNSPPNSAPKKLSVRHVEHD